MDCRQIPGRPAAWPAGSAAGCLAPCWVALAPGFCDLKLSGRQGPQPLGYLGARVMAGLLAAGGLVPAYSLQGRWFRLVGTAWCHLAPTGAGWLVPAAWCRPSHTLFGRPAALPLGARAGALPLAT